jgi:hypothetical protein
VFFLLFIVILGVVITILSYVLEPTIAHMSRRCISEDHVYLEWATNSTLQLHRLAYQGVGAGTWSGVMDEVPITQVGDKLPLLHLEDPLRWVAAGEAGSGDDTTPERI